MGELKTVLQFGWKYMRPYWSRVMAGVLLGCLCGMTAGSFIWATNTLAKRLSGEVAPAEAGTLDGMEAKAQAKSSTWVPKAWRARGERLKSSAEQVVDEWLPRTKAAFTWKRIVGGILFLPLLALIRGVTGYLSNYCLGWVSERVIADLRYDVLAKLTSLSLDYFNRSATGDMLTRINADSMNLHRALRQGCADLVTQMFTLFSVLIGLVFIDPKLTLVVFVLLPVIAIPLVILGKKARRAGREGRKATVGQTSLLVEALTGIRVLKAFNLEQRQLDRFREFAKKLVHHGMKGVQAKEMTNPIVEVAAALVIGALIFYLFWAGETLADLVVFVGGLAMFFTAIKKVSGVHILFEQAGAGVERLVELLNEKPTVVEPATPERLNAFQNEIRFDHVSFSYGHETVLHDLNLRIPRGFRLGVAGESGSGKSTVVNLLFRFYDVTGGTITIDGLDVRKLTFADLRRHMALVSQDIFVFRTTVAENIAAGKLNATRAEIEEAARSASAHEFISQLPQGYDTIIGERGMTLSGGQRQRLAIARAFVRNAPILVLDEATAALDSQSESEVQAAIERLEENRTVICVAHRLSTLASMNQIIVLAKGRVVEQGTFDELVRARGAFARMAARQGIS